MMAETAKASPKIPLITALLTRMKIGECRTMASATEIPAAPMKTIAAQVGRLPRINRQAISSSGTEEAAANAMSTGARLEIIK